MNVFVLGTGRCGTSTFVEACRHFTNYTAGHETLTRRLGAARFAYPGNHIEADNRLSWLLGRLDAAYGSKAFYVHLLRDPEAVAQSYVRRWKDRVGTLPSSYHRGVLHQTDSDPVEVCRDLVITVTENIRLFLRDKPQQMTLHIEDAIDRFPAFANAIRAEGDLDLAIAELAVVHNASPTSSAFVRRTRRIMGRALRNLGLR